VIAFEIQQFKQKKIYKILRPLVSPTDLVSITSVKEMSSGAIFVQKKLRKAGVIDSELDLIRADVELMRELTSMRCPNVVRYVDDDEDEEAIYLYLEYFEWSLNDLIQKKKRLNKSFSEVKVCEYAIQIAQGYVEHFFIFYFLFFIFYFLFFIFYSLFIFYFLFFIYYFFIFYFLFFIF
jgi:hypothetical protein